MMPSHQGGYLRRWRTVELLRKRPAFPRIALTLGIAVAMLAFAQIWSAARVWAMPQAGPQTRLSAQMPSKDLAPQLVVKTTSQSVQVAEPFQFKLLVTAATGSKVYFPTVPQTLGEFEVVDCRDTFDIPAGDLMPDQSSGLRTWVRSLTLESLSTGQLTIPSVEIQIAGDSGAQTLRSDEMTVRVNSVLEGRVDPADFRDIKPLRDMAIPQPANRPWVGWAAGGLGGLAALVVAIMVVARRRRCMTPQQWALDELKVAQQDWAQRAVSNEQALASVVAIIREYFELQFGIEAPFQATDEFLETVTASRCLNPDSVASLSMLLKMADETKFASLTLDQSVLDKAWDLARQLVTTTAELQVAPVSMDESKEQGP